MKPWWQRFLNRCSWFVWWYGDELFWVGILVLLLLAVFTVIEDSR